MARASDGTDVSVSPLRASSSIMGSPYGSLLDLERTVSRPHNDGRENPRNLLTVTVFLQNTPRIENCVQMLSQTVAAQTTEITGIEQIVGSVAARVANLETGAASGSSGPDSARSWNVLRRGDGSTATGSLGSNGLGSSDDNRNTRRRLDTFPSPDDERARSAVLLHFPCEQIHAGVSVWLDEFWATTNALAFNKPTRIHCKT